MATHSFPTGPDGPHASNDVAAATAIFAQWEVYKSIIDRDFMRHREISAAIHAFVKGRFQRRFSLLDLGCGDASAIPHTFAGTPLARYTGVDASAAALEAACRNLASAPFDVVLVESDLMAHLTAAAVPDGPRFDVTLAGYVIHHLSIEEKLRFFASCREVLAPAGALVFYDLFRQPGETRKEFVTAYTELIATRWGLEGEALDNTCRHVQEHDFPETVATIAALARDAGFTIPGEERFVDPDGFHRLVCFAT